MEKQAFHLLASLSRFEDCQRLVQGQGPETPLLLGVFDGIQAQSPLIQKYAATSLANFCRLASFCELLSQRAQVISDLVKLVSIFSFLFFPVPPRNMVGAKSEKN